MRITLSHHSALDALRCLRMEEDNPKEMDHVSLVKPTPWVGKQWSGQAFDSEHWRWMVPSRQKKLHVLVPHHSDKIRMDTVISHVCTKKLPSTAIVWLDEYSAMVGPELLFLQMASELSLPELVLLGHELCGNFSLPGSEAHGATARTHIPAATSVGRLNGFLSSMKKAWGVRRARLALQYVVNHALSFPEAVLSTMYALPRREGGYGLGPVLLNERVDVTSHLDDQHRYRFPDLLFSFAHIGINYDGEKHLDLDGIVAAAQEVERLEGEKRESSRVELVKKVDEVRAKVVDDMKRDRQLMAKGYIVLPMVKEDLYTRGGLDQFTLSLLECAHTFFGVSLDNSIKEILDPSTTPDRRDLLELLLSKG